MTMSLLRLLSKERDLRMIWEVEREGRRSRLVGTAHFFPYHFKGSLRRYIEQAEAVLLEGPLDEAATKRTAERGSEGGEGSSLYDALDTATIRKLNRELRGPSPPLSSQRLYQDLFGDGAEESLRVKIKGLKPWMAFFRIWSHYLTTRGWNYSTDLDALTIANEMGKDAHFLETIEEQIDALEAIPLERFVDFLKRLEREGYRRDYVRCYLRGDLERLMAVAEARGFPTFCEPIVGRRDPILWARMRPFFEKGNAIAFVGVVHCRGIKALLLREGYRMSRPSAP
jgi:uncharacterized protein YbaP (TraB family)